MMRRLSRGLTLGLWLGSAAFLSPLAGFAQSPAPAAPPSAAPPANPPATPPKPAADDKAAVRAAAENKALAFRQAFFDAKMAGLRAGLELTPAQVPLWTPVEAAIRDLAKLHLQMRHDQDRAPGQDSEAADPLHRLMRRSERLIEGGKAIKALTDATGPLVASLDQDQKDRLPDLLDHMRQGGVLRKAFNVPERRDRGDEGWRRSEMSRHGGHEDHAMGDRDHHPGRDGADRDDGDFRGHRGRHDWDRGGDRDFGSRDGDRFRGRDRYSDEDHDADNRRYDDHRGVDRHRGPDEDHHRRDDHDERT